MINVPAFAVVGHPNKGKSSLVATLSQDDSVKISRVPGTTVDTRTFPMKVDNEHLYTLIDTPGFQRSHKTLSWLKQHEISIDRRGEVVKQFVETFKHTDNFHDECQLLAPILAGAGILYVVDGSRPYASEFEAEMEILRWTGQPCMALINMIGEDDYSQQWYNALSQFFQIVRVFNAVTAEFEQHLELLRAFGQLKDEWRNPLDNAVKFILKDRQSRLQQSARLLAELISDSIQFTLHTKIDDNTDNHNSMKEKLQADYFNQLIQKERACRRTIEKIYHYHHLNHQETNYGLLDEDLFSEKTWSIFGLSQQELIMTGLAGGAAMGAVVDVAVGGTSLLLGAGVGAILGGVGAVFSYNKLANINILGMSLGGKLVEVGPMKNPNFPYVLMGRGLHHHQLIESRTHAMRSELSITDDDGNTGASQIKKESRKSMAVCFTNFRNNKEIQENLTDLSNLIIKCMELC